MWLQRPLPKALLQYAAHDLKLIAALYTSFVRAGWINGRDLPLLKEQSERYIRTLHTRALKDLFDQRNLGMFVSLHVIDTPPPDAQLYECESCRQQLVLRCFSTTQDGGIVQRRSSFCKLCVALAKRNSERLRGEWFAV